MIREFAFGLSNRHHFFEANQSIKWQFTAKDAFLSLYEYDEDVKKYFEEEKTLAGYTGKIYLPKEFILDVDGTSIKEARDKTILLMKLLDTIKVPYNVYFSGRGFHLGIPNCAFKWKPSIDLHLKVKDELTKRGIYKYADSSVSDKTRIIRLNNTLNSKSRLWKIYITKEEMEKADELWIKATASKPRKIEVPELKCEPVFNILEREVKKQTITFQTEMGAKPDQMLYPCIQKMLSGSAYGSRHAIALRLAAWFRWRYPEHTVKIIMEDWRLRVESEEHPFKKDEMDRIIRDCYKGHNGEGYRYGCMDQIMDKFCKDTCTLYTAKRAQGLMSPADMESNLISWLQGDSPPLNVGKLYNKDFPIYPGELVVVQAPPKTMKTNLLMNWVNAFKKPTYFLEMEMSPRQMWSRFIQIENGWNDKQLREYYQNNTAGGMAEKFKWLHTDYRPCYPHELEKRINMLPTKPEVVIIDHMGLMLSKHRDLNMKMEEIAGALTELAIKNNLVVFTISEITKQAFHEGMNISSVRGSFRIAYNASKILSLTTAKTDDGLVKNMVIKTEANRERGNLDVLLKVDNLRILAANPI